MDTGWDGHGEWLEVAAPCLRGLDWLFANREEAFRLTGGADDAQAAGRVLAAGARHVVIKLGAEGCLLAFGDRRLIVPGYAGQAIGTTGAGDAFFGGFLAPVQTPPFRGR